jgi:hypothetical protein
MQVCHRCNQNHINRFAETTNKDMNSFLFVVSDKSTSKMYGSGVEITILF